MDYYNADKASGWPVAPAGHSDETSRTSERVRSVVAAPGHGTAVPCHLGPAHSSQGSGRSLEVALGVLRAASGLPCNLASAVLAGRG
jgi:hypothetical protein